MSLNTCPCSELQCVVHLGGQVASSVCAQSPSLRTCEHHADLCHVSQEKEWDVTDAYGNRRRMRQKWLADWVKDMEPKWVCDASVGISVRRMRGLLCAGACCHHATGMLLRLCKSSDPVRSSKCSALQNPLHMHSIGARCHACTHACTYQAGAQALPAAWCLAWVCPNLACALLERAPMHACLHAHAGYPLSSWMTLALTTTSGPPMSRCALKALSPQDAAMTGQARGQGTEKFPGRQKGGGEAQQAHSTQP